MYSLLSRSSQGRAGTNTCPTCRRFHRLYEREYLDQQSGTLAAFGTCQSQGCWPCSPQRREYNSHLCPASRVAVGTFKSGGQVNGKLAVRLGASRFHVNQDVVVIYGGTNCHGDRRVGMLFHVVTSLSARCAQHL